MPIDAPDAVLRRICLAYPWSSECTGVAPIVPTQGETNAMWHGEDGYAVASGPNIPAGGRCESVQLIPVDHMGIPLNKISGEMTAQQVVSSGGPMHQFAAPRLSGFSDFPFVFFINKQTQIKHFL